MRSDAELVFPQAPSPGAKKVVSPMLVCRGTTGTVLARVANKARRAMVYLNMFEDARVSIRCCGA
jgi:hypothetical protein